MKFLGLWSVMTVSACAFAADGSPLGYGSPGLRPGDTAPEFSLTGSDGKSHALSGYKGKTVVVAWFPKAFTGG